jgi:hypothetical protein
MTLGEMKSIAHVLAQNVCRCPHCRMARRQATTNVREYAQTLMERVRKWN